jgi:plasmid maintenance system killer protein
MDTILNTATLKDCSSYPPGWRFKSLRGKLQGTYQVRIDDQYRIRFHWDIEQGGVGIVIGDIHDQDE